MLGLSSNDVPFPVLVKAGDSLNDHVVGFGGTRSEYDVF